MIDILNSYRPIQIKNLLHRIVETQEINATRSLVDTLGEQEILEHLIESSKPAIPYNMKGYHYLLSTPFRYPPLEYGSRFGTVYEPSLFYGSIGEKTCIAECAFYRFYFFYSMVEPPDSLRTQHTLFTVPFESNHSVDLSSSQFSIYADKLYHKSDYAFTQKIGSYLRNKGIDCFLYSSVRDPDHGLNVALFNPTPFSAKKPTSTTEWHSQITKNIIQFKNIRDQRSYDFMLQDFCEDDRLPQPAPSKATLDATNELESGKGKKFSSINSLMDDLNTDD
jgi:hypothetical protein